ncbi:MAG TPA: SDR family NAD(P)-dependent oxidoreductase [Sandaracinaceae bacterium LLY-WYZ-13_1]|nr:SDR family NAD(P)-dependent oxidoreductase [Sandaracinaceae bacterium LLY-WYZ-13_1]
MTKRRGTAVVTGASRGIGGAIARGLVAAGWGVIGTSRGEEGRASVEASGARWHPLDVTRRDSVGTLAEAVPSLDALVNNAGVALDGFDAEVVQRTLAVNFHGAMHVTDALLPAMGDGARIVMVSSGMGELSGFSAPIRAGLEDPALDRDALVTLVDSFYEAVCGGSHADHGWPSSAYRVSKAALNALVRVLDRELADDPRRIRVHAACPGWVATDMGGPSAPRSPAEGADTPIWLVADGTDAPSGRFFRDRRPIPF